jgi:hypothetical protein
MTYRAAWQAAPTRDESAWRSNVLSKMPPNDTYTPASFVVGHDSHHSSANRNPPAMISVIRAMTSTHLNLGQSFGAQDRIAPSSLCHLFCRHDRQRWTSSTRAKKIRVVRHMPYLALSECTVIAAAIMGGWLINS